MTQDIDVLGCYVVQSDRWVGKNIGRETQKENVYFGILGADEGIILSWIILFRTLYSLSALQFIISPTSSHNMFGCIRT
jgi:CTP:phosphocholine cytidylyltransferase-like protein